MAGQHIEDVARYEQTGLTNTERDKLILRMRQRGMSQQKIAHLLGLTQPAIHYALQRLTGQPRRKPVPKDMCEGCWDDFPVDQLNQEGLCPKCRSGVNTPS